MNDLPSYYYVALAPMAGVTDKVFRKVCARHGCLFSCTEMVSAQGLMTAKKTKNAYLDLLEGSQEEKNLSVQLFGSDPAWMARAARFLTAEGRFVSIDINMGCPAPKVTGSGNGSALMKTPERAGEIVNAVVKATFLPVTVKMRLGWDENSINAVQIARIAEQSGASALTVHGRTRAQQYAGQADWAEIGKVKAAVSIPVYLNGDIVSGACARQALSLTGCDGVAIGRGALGNPWIFEEIAAAFSGTPYTPPSPEEMIQTALFHAREMVAWKGERIGVVEMRKHFSWYVSGMRGAKKIRTQLHRVETLREAEMLLMEFINETESDREEKPYA